jgi:hypothetical protein
LKQVGKVSDLKVLDYHSTGYSGELLTPHIYTPIATYTWEELRSDMDLNALLTTSAAQAEIIELLTGTLYNNPVLNTDQNRTSIDTLAKKMMAKGLATLTDIIYRPFHAWVACTCGLINIWLIISIVKRFCCYTRTRRLLYPQRQRKPLAWTEKTAKTLDWIKDFLQQIDQPHQVPNDAEDSNTDIHNRLLQQRTQLVTEEDSDIVAVVERPN